MVRQTAQFVAVGANVPHNESYFRTWEREFQGMKVLCQLLLPGTIVPRSESAEERKVSHSFEEF